MAHPTPTTARGFGLRLRKEYLGQVLERHPPVDWFEIISEGYLGDHPPGLDQLLEIRERYPVVMHGISLGIGSPWPLDQTYLDRLKRLLEQLQPAWLSDHLCWSGADDTQGQMLPMPFSEVSLDHLVPRIQEVQEYLGCQLLLENVPSQPGAQHQEMPEEEFITAVAERSDSLILIDIANLHASALSHGFDPDHYLSRLPANRVRQIHLAGAVRLCGEELDSEQTSDPIWALYLQAHKRFGAVATMIERTDTIAPLDEMVAEVERARCAIDPLRCRE